ncbi:MAG: alpha/beta fold hydrolase [Anaerolineae bacterium]
MLRKYLPLIALVSAGLLLLCGISPLLLPVPPLPDTVPPEFLADPNSRFISLDTLRVHYKILGQGDPPLVLLHGFGASLFSWQRVEDDLAMQHTVLAFDRPAFGLTSRPMRGQWKNRNPYTPAAATDLSVSLMDALGLPAAVLVGHSAGAAVALQIAQSYPERVIALILISPAIEGGGPPLWLRPLLRLPQVDRFGPLVVRALLLRSGEQILERAWYDPRRIPPEIRERYRRPLRATDWDRALWEFTLASRPLEPEMLATVTAPTLIITGKEDRIVPPATSERLAGILPNAHLVIIPRCGHLAHEECPQVFLAELNTFLADLD